jgi:FKBP-type peptidyl-prolyl cis-trans isomerase SlyD
MTFKKGDFVEIEFTGRIKGGDIFDSNIKEDLQGAKIKGAPNSFVFSVGHGMFVKGVDEFLIGKETGEYNVELQPEDAFGKRDPKLIQMMPMKVFIQHRMNPIPGAMFNFDGRLAKIMTVSGGRVMVDFNNPIAGKVVEYKIIVKRKVEDQKEQVNALNDFFFRRKLESTIDGNKLKIKAPKGMKAFIEMFRDKYKEILGLDVEAEEVEETKKSE